MASYTQLRLARPCMADRRLLWERPLDPGRPTPSRVCRAVSAFPSSAHPQLRQNRVGALQGDR